MSEKDTIDESVYGLMVKMSVEEKLVVPLCKWDDVRVFAHGLKKKMDRCYTVNRMRTGRTKMDYILIRRTK